MIQKSEPIVFFGSGPVAAESLRLLARNFNIEAIITKPRALHHRGPVPVIDLSHELAIPTYTVSSRRELDELMAKRLFVSKLGVLIDFGIIVSQNAIDSFPLGIVNSHFSILPEWRGADPITFAILSGQNVTGVSLMMLVSAMDEGPLVDYAEQTLDKLVTTPILTESLIRLSNDLLKRSLPRIFHGDAIHTPQTVTGRDISYSRKLIKKDGVIDWQKSAQHIEREIRAFIEWPKSHTSFKELEVIITQARVINISGIPGERTIIKNQPVVFCKEQAIVIETIKPSGKKEMTGESFLAGYKKQFIQA